ncbi:MAG: hypothetical protein L0Y66_23235 [Myxococcaceae bacterium]|nr:hypothetical protein [Myxococcaceae bacterium]MCI0670967.1 hypothetical protein [Myxococcaceae bacterium]
MRRTERGSGELVRLLAVAGMLGGLLMACEPVDPGTPDSGEPDSGTDAGTDAGEPDTDMALVRLNENGTVDPSFGTQGIARVDLATGSGSNRDSVYGVARDSQDRLVLFGSTKGTGARVDVDRAVVRLTPNGARDVSFASEGVHTLDIANLNDTTRNGFVQADGKIVVSGYTSQPTGVGTQAANKIVLLRLNENGTADTSFGVGGVVNSAPFVPADPINTPWGIAEAYAVGRTSHGEYVTTGYGRAASSGKVDLVSFRYTDTGARDMTWNTSGSQVLDLVGEDDRGRNLVVLPDDRVLMVGSGIPTAGNIDAMLVMLRADGSLDTDFDPNGYKLYSYGGASEAFFGAALSPTNDRVAVVGHRVGAAGGATDDDDDDSILLVMPLGAGGTAFSAAVPLSDAGHDRLWAVTFDTAGRILAAGYVTEGTDRRMVVARFTPDGALDTTFGSGGKAIVNVAESGSLEEARGIVVQSNGKIVIAGTAERP